MPYRTNREAWYRFLLLECFYTKDAKRKLQPEGPIPGRKVVRKMTLCAT